jgi:hypothetical protein
MQESDNVVIVERIVGLPAGPPDAHEARGAK